MQDTRGRLHYASFLLDMSTQSAEQRAAVSIAQVTGERRALIVGLSRYRSASSGIRQLPLAGADAAALRAFLVSPQGGHQPDHVAVLLDENATSDIGIPSIVCKL